MTNILAVSDDLWPLIFKYLIPWDFISLRQTCSHLYHLSNVKENSAVNKYWQYQCQQQWKQVKHECTKTKIYSCGAHDKNYSYQVLFKSMVDFLIKEEKKGISGHSLSMELKPSHSTKILDAPQRSLQKVSMVELAYKMNISIDQIIKEVIVTEDITIDELMLSKIICADNIDLFRIWLCNMKMKDQNFTVNTPVPIIKYINIYGTKCILLRVVEQNAFKIASFLLGCGHVHDNDCNFPEINLNHQSHLGDTLLTLSCFKKFVQIVKLLINHPNMTKELMNTGDMFVGLTALHCAFCDSLNSNENDAIEIAKMLINDKRTNINSVNILRYTPLLYAMESKYSTKYVSMLIENDECDVNIQDSRGNTPLHLLVEKSCRLLLKKLLKRSDLKYDIKNKNGQTALDMAKANGWMQLEATLTQSMKSIKSIHDMTASTNKT